MKKIATDKMQSSILRDMIWVASADMVWISGAPSQLCVIDGEYVKRENLDEYDTLAYSLDALIDIICRDGADCHFYYNADDKEWYCHWKKVLCMNIMYISRVDKTKVDAAFEVVVALCNEGYIKKDHAER